MAFLDGYAGPGLYDDGAPGSPALAQETARLLGDVRTFEGHYVEEKASLYRRLRDLLANAPGHHVQHGRVEDHLDDILVRTSRLPLLAFFDPFGLALSMNDLTGKVMARPSWPATEIILNFSRRGIQRNTGKQTQPDVLEQVDAMLGGRWWRDLWQQVPDWEDRIREEYTERLMERAGAGWQRPIVVPVPRRPVGPIAYHLMFFSRSEQGLWYFLDCLAGAFEEFDSLARDDAQEELVSTEDVIVPTIERNIRKLLAERGRFRLFDHLEDVYGLTFQRAHIKHLRTAIKRLHANGETATTGKGDLVEDWIEPPSR